MFVAMNPFDVHDTLARNYARGRPYYHPQALAVAFEIVGRDEFELGLDLGCGTGLSTRALAQHARRVIGIDPSPAMLAAAEPPPGGIFIQASAEQLPLSDEQVAIITCAASMHWFGDRAFAEIARTLRPGGTLVVYSDFFLGDLVDQPRFADWMMNTYVPRLPVPPRRDHFHRDGLASYGVELVGEQQLAYDVEMGVEALTSYLITQSNATLAVTAGDTSEAQLRQWLEQQLTPIVTGPARARFQMRVWAAEKTMT
jgi:hypothetical protein